MTSDAVSPRKRDNESGRQLSPEQAAAAAMVAEAKARGPELTGPNGLLKLFTKNVLETALNEELTERLGRPKHHVEPGRESANVRNGSRPKTAISDAAGEVTFEPQIVKKRQRRLTDVDEIMLSLYAKGLTTGEISAHFAEIYGASVSKETISRITDTVVAEAKARGLELTGPNGLLKLFTKNVLETALNEELTEHLGHPKHQDDPSRESTNVRTGSRPKTVISDAAGEVVIDLPRDRESTFEPQIVKKRQRRLTDVDEIVLSLYAKGLTTGEISAHFAEIYGASVSKETISRITDTVVAEMQDWAARPLDGVYVAVFIDAIR